jgi:methyl-accepting chemotaxis protein
MASWLKKLFQTGHAPETDKAGQNAVLESNNTHVLDVHAAIQAHMAWKQRLEDFLATDTRDSLDPLHVCRDDQCALGKWIHGDHAGRYVHTEAYRNLRTAHADFHQAAARVVILAQAGDDEHAREELNTGAFAKASSKVKRELARIGLDG